MLLSLIVHINELRWTLPAGILLGSAPSFISIWSLLRALTCVLPSRVYQAADSRLYSMYQRMILCFFNTFTGVEVRLYGDTAALKEEPENVLFICNHQCTVDWIVANMLAAPQGSIGYIRYILKDGLKFFPLYGFYFRQHNCVYVKRSGKFSKEKAEKQIAELKSNHIPVWMVIFPEGTRYNPELSQVIAKSKQFARDQGYEELEHVLMPKMKALQLCLQQLQGYVTAVYDVTIAYGNTQDSQSGERHEAPGMPDFLMGKSKQVHLFFDRVPVEKVPLDDAGLQKWLYRRFQIKDKLMEYFYSSDASKRGKFPGESEVLEIRRRQTLPAFLFFGSILSLVLATSQGRSLYWKVGLFGTLGGCICMAIKS